MIPGLQRAFKVRVEIKFRAVRNLFFFKKKKFFLCQTSAFKLIIRGSRDFIYDSVLIWPGCVCCPAHSWSTSAVFNLMHKEEGLNMRAPCSCPGLMSWSPSSRQRRRLSERVCHGSVPPVRMPPRCLPAAVPGEDDLWEGRKSSLSLNSTLRDSHNLMVRRFQIHPACYHHTFSVLTIERDILQTNTAFIWWVSERRRMKLEF